MVCELEKESDIRVIHFAVGIKIQRNNDVTCKIQRIVIMMENINSDNMYMRQYIELEPLKTHITG